MKRDKNPTTTTAAPRPTLTVRVGHDRDKNSGETFYFFEALLGREMIYQDGKAHDTESKAGKAGDKWLARYRKAGRQERAKMLGVKPTAPCLDDGQTSESPAPPAPVGDSPAEAGTDKTGAKKSKTKKAGVSAGTASTGGKKPAAEREGLSGLDAAAQVLKDAGQALRCKDMVDTMLAKGMWKTGGKTPAATIYAAILREIQTKGAQARFKKTDRGQFALNV